MSETRCCSAVLLTCLIASPAQADDYLWSGAGNGIGATVGTSQGGELYRVTFGRDWPEGKVWRWKSGWRGTPFWTVSVGNAEPDVSTDVTGEDLWHAGAGINVRFSRPARQQMRFFADAGVGLHWVSETEFDGLDIDTAYQFSPNFAFGLQGQRWEFGYQLWHLSNAGTGDSNPGINFHQLRIGYRFNID